jgi:hypothetical protein
MMWLDESTNCPPHRQLSLVDAELRSLGILSRGRCGAWPSGDNRALAAPLAIAMRLAGLSFLALALAALLPAELAEGYRVRALGLFG